MDILPKCEGGGGCGCGCGDGDGGGDVTSKKKSHGSLGETLSKVDILIPTPYKVSTITATGSVNSLINLDIFYSEVELIDNADQVEGIIYIEFGTRDTATICRGVKPKKRKASRRNKKGKRFNNQVTVILKMWESNVLVYVNVKVFKNGNIQMTGLKDIDQGPRVIDHIIKQINDIYGKGYQQVVATFDQIMNLNYRIRLINSDFRIGLEIKRDKLNKLIQSTYLVFSSFEPCIYPGVKIQYFWNGETDAAYDGRCKCEGVCRGKGCGLGEGQCKKITIAAFQSGCIIITGAQNYKQIEDAYEFICKVVKDNRDDIEKIMPPMPPPRPPLMPQEIADIAAEKQKKRREKQRLKAQKPKQSF